MSELKIKIAGNWESVCTEDIRIRVNNQWVPITAGDQLKIDGEFEPITCDSGIIACGVNNSYSGGEAFPSESTVVLGSGLGQVTLNFDAYGIADKFVVIFDGVEVINTGYRGDGSGQQQLNNALADRGLPPETITAPGSGTVSFNKTTATSTAIVRVYAPLSGTAWQYTLGCPTTVA